MAQLPATTMEMTYKLIPLEITSTSVIQRSKVLPAHLLLSAVGSKSVNLT